MLREMVIDGVDVPEDSPARDHAGELLVRVAAGDRAPLLAERDEILALRRAKHPDWRTEPTAGSFFKNLSPAKPGAPRRAAGSGAASVRRAPRG